MGTIHTKILEASPSFRLHKVSDDEQLTLSQALDVVVKALNQLTRRCGTLVVEGGRQIEAANGTIAKRDAHACFGKGVARRVPSAFGQSAQTRRSQAVGGTIMTETIDGRAAQRCGQLTQVVACTTVYLEGSSACAGLPDPHKSMKPFVSEYIRGLGHTNGFESFSNMLRRAYKGTFHNTQPKHLNLYPGNT